VFVSHDRDVNRIPNPYANPLINTHWFYLAVGYLEHLELCDADFTNVIAVLCVNSLLKQSRVGKKVL